VWEKMALGIKGKQYRCVSVKRGYIKEKTKKSVSREEKPGMCVTMPSKKMAWRDFLTADPKRKKRKNVLGPHVGCPWNRLWSTGTRFTRVIRGFFLYIEGVAKITPSPEWRTFSTTPERPDLLPFGKGKGLWGWVCWPMPGDFFRNQAPRRSTQ